jgi:hypothetical protein
LQDRVEEMRQARLVTLPRLLRASAVGLERLALLGGRLLMTAEFALARSLALG